jgi:hypothetical protein
MRSGVRTPGVGESRVVPSEGGYFLRGIVTPQIIPCGGYAKLMTEGLPLTI